MLCFIFSRRASTVVSKSIFVLKSSVWNSQVFVSVTCFFGSVLPLLSPHVPGHFLQWVRHIFETRKTYHLRPKTMPSFSAAFTLASAGCWGSSNFRDWKSWEWTAVRSWTSVYFGVGPTSRMRFFGAWTGSERSPALDEAWIPFPASLALITTSAP